MRHPAYIAAMVKMINEDVEKALDHIDAHGVPRRRLSKRHCLVVRDKHYPPKHVLYTAYFLKTGEKLRGLRGGRVPNDRLRFLGYSILAKCGCGNQGIAITH
jgi:hypothetical protein